MQISVDIFYVSILLHLPLFVKHVNEMLKY